MIEKGVDNVNSTKLKQILASYVSNFETLSQGREQSNNLWIIAGKLSSNFDIDNPDLQCVLKRCWVDSGNVIDNAAAGLPFHALILISERAPETVRQIFKELFAAAYLNPELKQQAISAFISQCNELSKKWCPNSFRYKQDTKTAMLFLALRHPESGYIYKAREAKRFARQISFEEDFGTMTDFRLDNYELLCSEVLAEVKRNNELLEIAKRLGSANGLNIDASLHLLVWDIIYTSQTLKANDLYCIEVKIKDVMKARQMSQKELAERCGIREGTLSELLRNNRASVNLKVLSKISETLEVSDIRELIDFSRTED